MKGWSTSDIEIFQIFKNKQTKIKKKLRKIKKKMMGHF